MSPARFAAAAVLAILPAAAAADETLRPVTAGELCVTNGEVSAAPDGVLHIDSPSSRAVAKFVSGAEAEIRFRYLGPTAEDKLLASGELRRQIGLKLRAQDTCNLVYVMWHIAPDAKLAVLVKRNPGQSTHAQCGAHGYHAGTPAETRAVPPLVPGVEHDLRAKITGSVLDVEADGALVWRGDLGPDALALAGPVGLRTDNGRFTVTLLTAAPTGDATPHGCQRTAGD